MFDVPAMRVTGADVSARLGLPMRFTETETMYGAIAEERPVFNGYSGYAAPQHAALLDLLEHHDPRILRRLAATAPIEVVVEAAGDADGSWNGWLRAYPGAKPAAAGDGWTSYLLDRTGVEAAPPIAGTPLAIQSITASTNAHDIGAVLDGNLDSRWHAPQQDGGETITLDLGRAQSVGALVMCLGAYPGQYPRLLTIEASRDNAAWSTVYTGGTALETYDAALVSPREVPVTFTIQRDDLRFIRLRQAAVDTHGWSIVELRVIR